MLLTPHVRLPPFLHFLPAGNHFSYAKHAVSIRMGGVCLKLRSWKNAKRPWLLAVEDPQEMGKDVGSGSYAIRGECSGQVLALGVVQRTACLPACHFAANLTTQLHPPSSRRDQGDLC